MVNSYGFIAQARNEYICGLGVGVKIRPADYDVNGVVLALEDFIAGIFQAEGTDLCPGDEF